jgi:hypothetical protein
MIFRRKKKIPAKKPRVNTDDVIIGAAKTIGTAIGTASGAVEIGKQSAAEAKKIDTAGLKTAAVEKQGVAARQAKAMRKQAARQLDTTKKMAAKKADATKMVASAKAAEAKKLAATKAEETKKKAEDKVDELRETAAEKIAPRKKRGLLARIRR